MHGTLHKINNQWVIKFLEEQWEEGTMITKTIPVYSPDIDPLWDTNSEGSPVWFDIIDEYIRPDLFIEMSWGDGPPCAKINNVATHLSPEARRARRDKLARERELAIAAWETGDHEGDTNDKSYFIRGFISGLNFNN